MKFLDLPQKIVPALEIIRAAINERWKNFFGSETGLLSLDIPARSFQSQILECRDKLIVLFQYCFPRDLFGTWSRLHPFENCTEIELRTEIVRRLRQQEIDPAGFFPEIPCRTGNGSFITACSYLLNECLLYRLPRIRPAGEVTIINYSDYDANKYTSFSGDWYTPDIYSSGDLPGTPSGGQQSGFHRS